MIIKIKVVFSGGLVREFNEVDRKLREAMDKIFELSPPEKRVIQLNSTDYKVSDNHKLIAAGK